MTGLTDFLLARITEDERLAFADAPRRGREWELEQIDDNRSWDLLAMSHRRVLAECEAKRRIVELSLLAESEPEGARSHFRHGLVQFAEDALALLALPYADHPDYKGEWKP